MFDNPFKADWSDLFYRQPDLNEPRLKEFQRWLFRNKEQEIVLFHGTSKQLPIMEQGLLPTSGRRRRSYQSTSGFVYLSVFPTSAETFGQMGYPGHEIVVYGVRTQIKKLKADKDQLANKRHWAELNVSDTLAHSLVFGYGARHRGKIEPWQLSVEELVGTQ